MKRLNYPINSPPFQVDINLPSSKSISNRLLIIRYLSHQDFPIENLSMADDTVLLDKILKQVSVDSPDFRLDVKNAGTAMRFLTAAFSVSQGEYVLNCSERMKLRPIAPLVDSLRNLGAEIGYLEKEGFPPLHISGKSLNSEFLQIDAGLSSQFVSALLMMAPLLPKGLELELKGNRVSKPYISMTISLMQKFGIEVKQTYKSITVQKGSYKPLSMSVEADWSSAAFFYEAVALAPLNSEIFLPGLFQNSLQGDAVLSGLFDYLGVETSFREDGILIRKISAADKNIRIDFTDYPDLALPIIVACAGLEVIGTFTGLENLVHKESNRVEALEKELTKFGYDFRATGFGEWVLINSCAIDGAKRQLPENVVVETYDDHRVAMAFAPLMLLAGKLKIKNPQIVEKSFPDFWEQLDRIG